MAYNDVLVSILTGYFGVWWPASLSYLAFQSLRNLVWDMVLVGQIPDQIRAIRLRDSCLFHDS